MINEPINREDALYQEAVAQRNIRWDSGLFDCIKNHKRVSDLMDRVEHKLTPAEWLWMESLMKRFNEAQERYEHSKHDPAIMWAKTAEQHEILDELEAGCRKILKRK